MKLRTEILLPPCDWQLDHHSKIVSIGSCFAERMSERLRRYKFDCFFNPFGIIFHPTPMIAPLIAAIDGDHSLTTSSFLQDGLWQNLAFHSKMSHADPLILREMIVQALDETALRLKTADLLILTLGSSLGFYHRASNQIVGNCHRLPANLFELRQSRLGVLQSEMEAFLNRLRAFNPNVRVLLTVSPVRHLRSGIVENAGSKAVLRALCGELEADFAFVSYFPAWELLVDDLRDYRFYAADMAHPSDLAEDYIWRKFEATWIKPEAQKINEELQQIYLDLQHLPRHPESDGHRQFLMRLKEKIEGLRGVVSLDQELIQVEHQLGLK